MRKLIPFLLTLLCTSLGLGQQKPIVLVGVTLIDMVDARPKSKMCIVIAGNRIAAVGKCNKTVIPRNAQTIDAHGKFLIPGLWDMHVHALRPERVDSFFPLFIVNGITGIREMGTTEAGFASLSQLRREIAAGTRVGPRIIAAGRILDGAKPAVPENSIAFSNDLEARAAVRFLKQAGADFIKVYDGIPRSSYFAIIDEARQNNIPFAGHVPTEVTAFEASAAGQKSFEHLVNILRSCSTLAPREIDERARLTIKPDAKSSAPTAIPNRIAATIRIELETYNTQKCDELFSQFVQHGTWQVPTLVVKQRLAMADAFVSMKDPRMKYVSPVALETWKPENNLFLKYRTPEFIAMRKQLYEKELQLVAAMHRAGVKFMAGTDIPGAFLYPGFSLHDELGLLVQAGFTPFEALQAATCNPADFLNRSADLGTIEKGKLADLVLLDANPLPDISNTRRIDAVIFNGRYFSKAARERLLAEVAAVVSAAQPNAAK